MYMYTCKHIFVFYHKADYVISTRDLRAHSLWQGHVFLNTLFKQVFTALMSFYGSIVLSLGPTLFLRVVLWRITQKALAD